MAQVESLTSNNPQSVLQEENLRASSTSTSSTQERWRKILIKRNKGFLAQPINQVGLEVSKINFMFPPVKNPPEIYKTLFPRSVVYEIPYKKKQAELKIQEALRREREALAEKVKMKLDETLERNKDDQTKRQDEKDKELEKMRKEKEPFWYEEGKEAALPPRRLAEYDVNKGLRVDRPEDVNVREMMGIADSRNYIPGQVSGNIPSDPPPQPNRVTRDMEMRGVQLTPHPPLPYTSSLHQSFDEITETEKNIKKFESECHPKRPAQPAGSVEAYPIEFMGSKKGRIIERPKVAPGYVFGKTDIKGNVCKDFPGTKARLTTPWGDLRSEEFMKVGRPFKTQAARWTECAMPAFKPEEELEAIRERLIKKYQIKN